MFDTYFLDILKNKYATFSGRARRKEFWMFYLCNLVITAGIYILARIVPFLSIISALYGLAILVPSLALAVRRLYDTNRNWPWIFIAFVPIIGSIWLIVLMCLEGTVGDNQYGSDPKAEERY